MLGCFRRRKRRRIECLTANRLALRVAGRQRCAAVGATGGPAVGVMPPRGAATRDLQPGLGTLDAKLGILSRQQGDGIGQFVDFGKVMAGAGTWAVTDIMSQGLLAITERKIRVSEVLRHNGLIDASAEIRRITIEETAGERQKQF